MIKPIVYLKNQSQKFIARPTRLLATVMIGVCVTGTLYVASRGLLAINAWSAVNELQRPLVLLTNQGDTIISLVSRPVIVKRKPLEVLSPYILEDVDVKNLSKEDQMIYDTFGALNFREARAVAKCESGKQRLSTNWDSRDIGFWQINLTTWRKKVVEKFGWDYDEWYNLEKNFKIAYWIWDRGDGVEGNGKGNFNAWVAKTTDCFVAEL